MRADEGDDTHNSSLESPARTPTPGFLCLQKTKDHFLEVKMESSEQPFFHLLSNFAYIEVRPCRRALVCTGGSHACGGLVLAA